METIKVLNSEDVAFLKDSPTRITDTALVTRALRDFIERHTDEEQQQPYLHVNGGKSYTLAQLLTEIESGSDLGHEMAQGVVALTVDQLARGKQNLTLPKVRIGSGKVVAVTELLSSHIPIHWDRFTVTEDGFYVVYGWIPRSDHNRDFLMLEMWESDPPSEVFYTTSSAKYSKQIMEVLYGDEFEHNDCRKIEELYQLQ